MFRLLRPSDSLICQLHLWRIVYSSALAALEIVAAKAYFHVFATVETSQQPYSSYTCPIRISGFDDLPVIAVEMQMPVNYHETSELMNDLNLTRKAGTS